MVDNLFLETIMHPFAGLKKVGGLHRLPDRRISKDRRGNPRYDERDPLRGGRGESMNQALGIYANEETRIELYENYAEQDQDGQISSVLDEFAAEASQPDPDRREVVWVDKAGSEEVRKTVIRCLRRIKADHIAFPYMRSLGRDGDVMAHIAAARGEGVLALKPYDPWQVARVEDGIGRLTGFAPADDRGAASKVESNALPFWRVLHWRLPPRSPTEDYGATSSFLHGSRIKWRELQLMLDQVVIQRLLRRPDRLMVMLDTTGLSHDESYMMVKDYERRMHREWFMNPDQGQFLSQGIPLDIAKDFILPRGPNNQTEITNFPATSTNDLLRDLELFYRALANSIGYPYGFMRGEGGNYQGSQSLSRQHYPFSMRADRLQRSFLEELVRCCMIDLAFQGLDITRPENQFELHMTSVNPIMELERQEVMQMKIDRLERAMRLGGDAGIAPEKWMPFVFKRYGGFSDDVINEFFPQTGGQAEGRRTSLRTPKEVLQEVQREIDTLFPTVRATGHASSLLYPAESWDRINLLKPKGFGGGAENLHEGFDGDRGAEHYMSAVDTSGDPNGRESRREFSRMRARIFNGKFWDELGVRAA